MNVNNVNIERAINDIENTLTNISAYPGVGSLAGIAKVLMGTAQVVTAISYGIFNIIPSINSGDWSNVKYSFTHIKHGVGNITAGVFETIPLLQTVLYIIRQLRQHQASDRVHLQTRHENKFMPYASLEKLDLTIGGADEDAAQEANQLFNAKIQEYANGEGILLENITLEKKIKFGEEALRTYYATLQPAPTS